MVIVRSPFIPPNTSGLLQDASTLDHCTSLLYRRLVCQAKEGADGLSLAVPEADNPPPSRCPAKYTSGSLGLEICRSTWLAEVMWAEVVRSV